MLITKKFDSSVITLTFKTMRLEANILFVQILLSSTIYMKIHCCFFFFIYVNYHIIRIIHWHNNSIYLSTFIGLIPFTA